MRTKTLRHYLYEFEACGIDVRVEIEYTPEWHEPAQVHGPPEKCYPAEGEPAEISALRLVDIHKHKVNYGMDQWTDNYRRQSVVSWVGEEFVRRCEEWLLCWMCHDDGHEIYELLRDEESD